MLVRWLRSNIVTSTCCLAEPLVAKPLGATVLAPDPDDITAIDPMLRVQIV